TYYRFAEVGGLIVDGRHSQLASEWKRFAVHFDDLPQIESGVGLRVGFDLMGQGEFYVDQVEIFDRWMDENDLKTLTQMVASIGPLIQQPVKMEQCRKILEGYWPMFLKEYVGNSTVVTNPSGNKDPTAAESRATTIRSSMRRRWRRLVSPGIFQFR
ncbi:MAG: hypothetical protein AAGA30_06495, partial [Planctomycetota bacterium]